MSGTHTITSARLTASAARAKASVMATHTPGAAPTANRHPRPMGRRIRSPSRDIPRKWASLAHMIVVAETGSVR